MLPLLIGVAALAGVGVAALRGSARPPTVPPPAPPPPAPVNQPAPAPTPPPAKSAAEDSGLLKGGAIALAAAAGGALGSYFQGIADPIKEHPVTDAVAPAAGALVAAGAVAIAGPAVALIAPIAAIVGLGLNAANMIEDATKHAAKVDAQRKGTALAAAGKFVELRAWVEEYNNTNRNPTGFLTQYAILPSYAVEGQYSWKTPALSGELPIPLKDGTSVKIGPVLDEAYKVSNALGDQWAVAIQGYYWFCSTDLRRYRWRDATGQIVSLPTSMAPSWAADANRKLNLEELGVRASSGDTQAATELAVAKRLDAWKALPPWTTSLHEALYLFGKPVPGTYPATGRSTDPTGKPVYKRAIAPPADWKPA